MTLVRNGTAKERRMKRRGQTPVTEQLCERVKELDCLYGILALIDNPDIPLEAMLQGIVDLIPPAWQYAESTAARILLGDREYRSEGFCENPWLLAQDLKVRGDSVGRIEVCHLEEKPDQDEGPFLQEKRTLLDAIARQVGKAIEYRQAELASITGRAKAEAAPPAGLSTPGPLPQTILELSPQSDLDDLLHSIVSRATELLEGTAGGIYLYRPDRDVLEWVVVTGPNVLPIGSIVHKGEGLVGRVWQTGEPQIVDNYQQWKGRLVHLDVHSWGGMVGIPIRQGREDRPGDCLGVLTVMKESPGRFSPNDVKFLDLFASQAALAIRNVRLYRLAQQELAERRQAEQAVLESEERLRSTISSMDDLLFVIDQDGYFLDYYHPLATSGQMPIPPEAFLGKTVVEVMPPEISVPFEKALEAVADTGQPQQFDYSLGLQGEKRWYGAKLSQRRDSRGAFGGVTVVVRDITERKQAEERIRASLREKEVLLKEVHHRVKNNLQVISSLLDMQACSVQDGAAVAALEDSQYRVRTMAYVHERLYQSENLASIDVAEYLDSLVGNLLAAYKGGAHHVSVDTSITPIPLDLDSAISLGLIANELISNCLKYAFPPDHQGPCRIRVRLDVSDGDRITLEVSDNGAGLPPDLSPENAQSLGLRLVEMLTQQLHGKLELDRNEGTAFRLTFALPELEASGEVEF
jgi:PAS domain S-box-containing protein